MTAPQRRHVVILDENLPVPLDRRVWLEALALRAAGWQVSVIAPRGDRPDLRAWSERRQGIRILRYPQRAATGLSGYIVEYVPSLLFTLGWLLALRLRGPVHVVHGCNPPDLFFLFGSLARTWGAQYVYDQHDANPELAEAKWGAGKVGSWLVRLTRALEAASYRTASLVVVPNQAYGHVARTRGGVGEDRLVVVPNAPPAREFAAMTGGITPPREGLRVGYLGVMGSQDGVDILVDAIAHLRTRWSGSLEVHLVGDGESRPLLERRVAELDLGDVVRFHGYQSPNVFVPILAACHVCVSPDPPTPFNDLSTMTKVVEYLAIGRPVVAFDLAETRRLIGDAGIVVGEDGAAALGEAIARLALDREHLAVLSKAAGTRFAELDMGWERSAAILVQGYEQLGPGRRPAPGPGG
jgi:glycosyltransferase involved in cell wall biosynthesis